jgi:hypothetical protein
MTMNPKLVIPLLVLPLLTGCSMNAPMDITVPIDVHDNTFNTGPVTGVPVTPTTPPLNSGNPLLNLDPNELTQNIPEGWSKDSVDIPEPIPLPEGISSPKPQG